MRYRPSFTAATNASVAGPEGLAPSVKGDTALSASRKGKAFSLSDQNCTYFSAAALTSESALALKIVPTNRLAFESSLSVAGHGMNESSSPAAVNVAWFHAPCR